jgi:hypothetical protein
MLNIIGESNMENYFCNEIKNIKRELTQLKTSQQRFAGEVPLVSKNARVSLELSLNQSQTVAIGEKFWKLTMEKESLFVVSLQKYYDDVTKSEEYPRTTRVITFEVGKSGEREYLIHVIGYGTQWGDNNDVDTIRGGGRVTLENVLTVKSTDDFNLEEI